MLVAKVIDFGVARAIGQRQTEKTIYTRFAAMIGTSLYMSPEQAEMSGVDEDTRSDIYSLGVMLYELFTGFTPFDRERFRAVGIDEVLRFLALEVVLVNSDGYWTRASDYCWLLDEDQQFHVIPHDMNEAFHGGGGPGPGRGGPPFPFRRGERPAAADRDRRPSDEREADLSRESERLTRPREKRTPDAEDRRPSNDSRPVRPPLPRDDFDPRGSPLDGFPPDGILPGPLGRGGFSLGGSPRGPGFSSAPQFGWQAARDLRC